MVFKQTYNWFTKREYIIGHSGVTVLTRSFIGTSIKFFDFPNIGREIIIKKKRSWLSIAMAIILFGIGAWLVADAFKGGGAIDVAIVSVILGVLVLFIFPGSKYLYLHNTVNKISIEFLYNIPSEEALFSFLGQLKKAQRIKLQQQYLTIDANMSYDEYRNNIIWLRDNDFLSKEDAAQRLVAVNTEFS